MPRSSKPKASSNGKMGAAQIARVAMGVLVVLNLIAAWLVFNPPGGSAEALEQDLARLQGQVRQAKARMQETKQHAVAVQKGRGDADAFLDKYFVTRRTLPTNLLDQLGQIARQSGIQDRGTAFSIEQIEGSENLGMVMITANFEGSYRSLLNFVREIDRSPSLLIIESLNAAPQQGSNNLMVAIKMEAFIREDVGDVAQQVAQAEGSR